ncbi:MAG: hypothetical protein Q9217_001034 [Psora testacea]
MELTRRQIWITITYIPKRCRYDPDNPPGFSMGLNLLFGFAATFTVANLYYNHPVLNKIAQDFHITNERASLVPTMAQTVLPLVGDLAPPHRRATALSIVVSGLILGLLIARLLSGVIAEYTSWRNIYWLALGLQYLIFALLWLFLPHYPSTNPSGLTYPRILRSIVTMLFKHPILVQACLIGFCTSATFTSFWTTLTFLLSSPPYSYNPLTIGLFALIGIGAMCIGPFYSRLIIDRFVPMFSVILGLLFCLTGIAVGTFTGTFTIAGPIIQAFLLDVGLQTSQIANRSSFFSIEPKARNRTNTAFMVSAFCGQLVGTAVGNSLYAKGGWVRSGSASIGFVGLALCFCAARGPWEKRWVGWRGGWNIRKKKTGAAGPEEEKAEADNFDVEKSPATAKTNFKRAGSPSDDKNAESYVEKESGEGTQKR